MNQKPLSLTLGPLLFNWPAAVMLDFYRSIAQASGIDRVYLGEVVCGKRAPLLEAAQVEAADLLERAGKQVVWSTPSLPITRREWRAAQDLILTGGLIELNDISGLSSIQAGATFVAGPFLNIYNEAAAAELVRLGCRRLCPNIELSLQAIGAIHAACPELELELFSFGRLPLALSGRCHHAHLHRLQRDGCQFVCERDPDGLAVETLEGDGFLALNGVMTMSQGVQVLDVSVEDLRAAGIGALRLSPHSGDMVGAIAAYRRFADGAIDAAGLQAELPPSCLPGPAVSGYLAGAAGMRAAAHA
ncbi:U32 family peptidase [Phenylobacterium sp.]|uniref:ubiquinone anaerobic biosynthesis protein UbiV n=1 Tax=Phenylobacterium sp. TaxID=1871053 RepID=UPI0035B30A1F